ncbi:MAG: MBOAT family O-acyltransferase [Bacteroidota bacterium]
MKAQNLLILAASYFFYAWWDWRFLSLIVLSSLTDFVVGQKISDSHTPQHKKYWLWLSLAINLGMLGFFKYYNFFIDSFVDLFAGFGYDMPRRTLSIILPVGISFYTFQTLSYTIDIYRGRVKACRDLPAFLAFVSFFPQLVAGPIERAANFLPQFSRVRKFELEKAKDGARQVLWGLFKKVVVADTIGATVDEIVGHTDKFAGIYLLIAVFLFAFQLYGDFSGYSDIAIGTARMLGFKLMRNFNFPFFARDMMDFWRRWHISLTSWFKDYVFLGFSKGKVVNKKWVVIRNYILTFTISGLWHGASWTFVVWGLLHGLYQVPYMIWPGLRTNVRQTRPPFTIKGTLLAAGQMAMIWALNLFALVFFMSKDMKFALGYLSQMFSSSLIRMPKYYLDKVAWVFVFMAIEWWTMYQRKDHPLEKQSLHPVLRWGIYYGMALIILYFNYDRRAFVYFQF